MGPGRVAVRSETSISASPPPLFFSPFTPFFALFGDVIYCITQKACKQIKVEVGRERLQRIRRGCTRGMDALRGRRGLCSTEPRAALSSFCHPKAFQCFSQGGDGASPHQEPINEAAGNEPQCSPQRQQRGAAPQIPAVPLGGGGVRGGPIPGQLMTWGHIGAQPWDGPPWRPQLCGTRSPALIFLHPSIVEMGLWLWGAHGSRVGGAAVTAVVTSKCGIGTPSMGWDGMGWGVENGMGMGIGWGWMGWGWDGKRGIVINMGKGPSLRYPESCCAHCPEPSCLCPGYCCRHSQGPGGEDSLGEISFCHPETPQWSQGRTHRMGGTGQSPAPTAQVSCRTLGWGLIPRCPA